MNPPASPDPTIEHTPSHADTGDPGPADRDAALGGTSILGSFADSLPGLPRVRLPEPGEDRPAENAAHRAPYGRYQIEAEVARGGMGIVLRGRDTDLGRPIALKVLLESHRDRPDLVRRFIEEAQIAGQLQHPGVVPVYELGRFPDQRPYFTMKLVKGRTLAELLRGRAQPADDRWRFLKVFEQVCQAMAYAHARAVIHRDLKPANIMVGAFGEVQIMDWGLAKVVTPGEPPTTPAPEAPPATISVIRTARTPSAGKPGDSDTQAGSVLGTPAYMAPEQALGEVHQLDARCDVFGLGAILCETLTGQPPYGGGDTSRLLRRAARADLADAFTRLDGCGADAELVGLARRCLSAEPGDRPRDAGVLAEELTAYLGSVEQRLRQAELATAEARARAEEERKRRRVIVALAASVLVTVLVAGGGWLWQAQERAARERVEADRQAETARQVHEALARAQVLRDEARAGDPVRWTEARAAAERAEALAESGPAEAGLAVQARSLLHELDEEERDRRWVHQLEEIRFQLLAPDPREWRALRGRALTDYRQSFAEHGLAAETAPEGVVARVRRLAAGPREALLGALDQWQELAAAARAPEAAWLAGVIELVDPDAWRRELRAAIARGDRAAVDRLAESEEAARQPPFTLGLLSEYCGRSSPNRALALLQAGLKRLPGDFWLNYQMAAAVDLKNHTLHPEAVAWEDVVRYATVAHALRPAELYPQLMLGHCLSLRGRHAEALVVLEEVAAAHPTLPKVHGLLAECRHLMGENDAAVVEYRKALELDPNSSGARNNLALAVWNQGRLDEAIAELRREHLAFPSGPTALVNLATALADKGRFDESVRSYQEALRLAPSYAAARQAMSIAQLLAAGKADSAVTTCQFATGLQPDNPVAHIALGISLREQGKFGEAARTFRRAGELVARHPSMSILGTAHWVRDCERLATLESELPALVKGERTPRDVDELRLLALLCRVKKQYRAEAELYVRAFAAEPTWAEDPEAERRYDAACAAARAVAEPGEEQRARWRKQALEWLRADLARLRVAPDTSGTTARALVRWTLEWWTEDPAFAGLRNPAALAALPTDERAAWELLWAEVKSLASGSQ